MIFHKPDKTFGRLKACWKRADRNAAMGVMDKSHRLAAAWENAKMFISADEGNVTTDTRMKLFALDWFALKVDEYSKSNMIDGDTGLAHILYEWRERMPIDPSKLTTQ